MSDRIVTLPEGYDPSSDQGRSIVELFLDGGEQDIPPSRIRVEPLSESRWIAVAQWDEG